MTDNDSPQSGFLGNPEFLDPHSPHLDGNALAGALREIFAVDLTAADAPCAGCGQAWVLAQLLVYAGPHAPGLVARCPGCDAVLLRMVRGPAGAWLDLRGVAVLRVPLPPLTDELLPGAPTHGVTGG